MALAVGSAAIVFGLAVYWLRWRLLPSQPSGQTLDLSMHANRAVAVLHALIIALVFAEAEIDYSNARNSIWQEADLLQEVFRDLHYFESAEAEETARLVAEYTRELIDREWDLLAINQLSDEAGQLLQTIYDRSLQLPAETPAQNWLYEQILTDLRTLSGLRHARFFESHDRLPVVFWLVIVLGYVLLCGLFSVYPKSRTNLAVAATFSFFFGVVTYLIFAFQDPFDGHMKVTSQPLSLLYQDVMEPTLSGETSALPTPNQ
jgi:hypothetical protein